jgi:hypothetical protein
MKINFLYLLIISIAGIMIFSSCKKESSNHPPIANAGPDQTITLPTNTVSVNGSSSSDPDNNI